MTLALAQRAVVPRDRQVLDLFRPAVPAEVGVSRSGSDYTLLTALGGNRYLATVLKSKTFGAYTLHLIDTTYIQSASLVVLFNDAAIVRTGAGWALSTLATTFAPGDYFEWVAPANTSRITLGTQVLVHGGVAAVTVDGDGTLASALPTAQSLVDAGTIQPWALSTNVKTATDAAIAALSTSFTGTFDTPLDAADVGRPITIAGVGSNAGPDLFLDQGGAGDVETGANWLTSTSASFYGGTARYVSNPATTPGNYRVWTTPTCVKVGVRTDGAPSCGYAKVTIDGDATRANLCPTVQQEIDAGRLTTAVLVANGGLLLATDRVVETYNATQIFNVLRPLADGLANTTHTVRLDLVGYKRPAASLSRVFVDGWIYNEPVAAADLTTTIATVTGPTSGTVATAATEGGTGKTATATGGTLTPTQRVLDGYAATTSLIDVLLAETDPVPSTRTLRVTNTAYYNVASTAQRRLNQGAISYSTPATTPQTPGAVMATVANVYNSATGQNAEYAIRAWPAGATYTDFVGNNHAYDEQLSLAFSLDGAAITPADGSTTWGKRLVVTRTTKLHHPDLTLPAYLADVVTTYTLAGLGLVVENVITWQTAGLTASTSYLSMFSIARYFQKCTTLGSGTVGTLTADDDGVRNSRKSSIALAWMDPGNYAVAMVLDSLEGVDYWRLNPNPALWIQDRANIDINKMYAGRCTGVENMGVGTIWRSKARYLAQHFTDPEALFASLPAFA